MILRANQKLLQRWTCGDRVLGLPHSGPTSDEGGRDGGAALRM